MKLAALWLGVGSIDCGGIVAKLEDIRSSNRQANSLNWRYIALAQACAFPSPV
jgi:hypothetical protein